MQPQIEVPVVTSVAKAFLFLKREVLEVAPAAIFFLVGFNLITASKHLILARQGIIYDGMATATIGALLIAKVVMLADLLPTMRRLHGRPLYRPVLVRSLIYTAFAVLAQQLEGLIRGWIDTGDLLAAFVAIAHEFEWKQFVFVQSWIFALFLVYVAITELCMQLGHTSIWNALSSRISAMSDRVP